jgi:hypothetical protein
MRTIENIRDTFFDHIWEITNIQSLWLIITSIVHATDKLLHILNVNLACMSFTIVAYNAFWKPILDYSFIMLEGRGEGSFRIIQTWKLCISIFINF